MIYKTIFKTTISRQIASIFIVVLACWPRLAGADKVTDWNEIGAIAAVTNAAKSPPAATIDLAYMHIAIYDAVNAIDGRYRPFAITSTNVPQGASEEAATVAAAYNTLLNLLPTQQAYLDAAYAASLATIPDGQSKDDGIALGQDVAVRFIAQRACDGRNANVPYTPGTDPGDWQPTPPAFAPALNPWISQMQPFAILRASQFRAPAPPALTSNQYAKDFNEVKSIGSVNSTTRTDEQTEIGKFYSEHTGFQYARAFRDFAIAQNLGLADNARLFAMIYVASADALIACWDSKFHYSFWRPVTSIPAADLDGNPNTTADPSWLPLIVTPPHPEYPSAHGSFTAAYAEILRYFFNTKNVTITLTSTVTGTSRTFHNTNDLVKEIIEARIYGGIHYRNSCVQGKIIGKKVADWVTKYFFQPVE
jgi:hypothetical protein